ncbi:MAG TPA: CsbD family protein [Thermomicrobiales bacterium]|nr:CsbD family protein [Thermomicrobiales bacterium]
MSDSSRDRIEGEFDEKKGDVKEGLGKLRDDENQEAEGQADQAQGKVKQGIADAKDKVDDAVKKITNS